MITKEVSTKIVNDITIKGGVLMRDIQYKCIISVKQKSYFILGHRLDIVNIYLRNNIQVRFYLNCNFHDFWGRDSCARTWPCKSYCENAWFYQKSQVSFLDRRLSVVCPTVCKLFLFPSSQEKILTTFKNPLLQNILEPLGKYKPNIALCFLVGR